MRQRIVAFLASVVAAACGGSGSETEVPFDTVASTPYSGFGSGEHVVVRSDRELNALWARMTAAPPMPRVDFAAAQVVAVFLGSRPDGCHGVAISSVTRGRDRLVVLYRESTPAPGDSCTRAIVTPAHFVAVARSPLPVEFEAE